MKKQFTPEERNRIRSTWKERESVVDVAKELAITWDTARRWLDALGYRRDPTDRQKKLDDRDSTKKGMRERPWRDSSWLKTLYVERRLPVKVTAKLAGCCPKTLSQWLKKYGMSVRKMKGVDHYAAKLTEADVREMRARYAEDKTIACREELAREKGVAVSTVNKVVFRQSWKHVK